MSVYTLKGAVCVSTGNGNWSNSGSWSCGSVPACGDSIVIQAGHTMSITAADYDPCSLKTVVVIKGTLQFITPGKLELSCLGRVYIFTGGHIVAAVGQSGNSNAVMQCASTWWNAGAGTYNGPGCMPPFLAGCATVLPIELISFTGEVCDERVCLSWLTGVEYGLDYFEILRSEDGMHFYSISRIYDQGTQTEKGKKYTALDPKPAKGINYYRLKQVDKNGQSAVYPIVAVDVKAASHLSLKINPNPNDGHFSIAANGLTRGEPASLRIYDQRGNKIFDQLFDRQVDEASVLIDGELAPGVYFAELLADHSRQIQKLVICP